jgi:hypothetical protein
LSCRWYLGLGAEEECCSLVSEAAEVIDGEREYGYGLMSKVMSMWNIVFKLGAVIMYLMSWVFFCSGGT